MRKHSPKLPKQCFVGINSIMFNRLFRRERPEPLPDTPSSASPGDNTSNFTPRCRKYAVKKAYTGCGPKSTVIRKKLTLGLDNGVPLGDNFFVGFFEYYTNTGLKDATNIKNQVSRLSKIFYYCQDKLGLSTDHVDINCLRHHTHVTAYLRQLESGADFQASTIKTYEEAITNCYSYVLFGTELRTADPQLWKELDDIRGFYKIGKQGTGRKIQTAHRNKRFEEALQNKYNTNPFRFLELIESPEVLERLRNIHSLVESGEQLKDSDIVFYTRHLMYIIICFHGQRVSVPEGFRTCEYKAGVAKRTADGDAVFFVRDHKTAASQAATFALSSNEVDMFIWYHEKVRKPYLVRRYLAVSGNAKADDEPFFMNSKGIPYTNVTKELERYFDLLNCEKITSTDIRKQFETLAGVEGDTEEKKMIAEYLAHTNETARKHYRQYTIEAAVKTMRAMKKFVERKRQGQSGSAQKEISKKVNDTADSNSPEEHDKTNTNMDETIMAGGGDNISAASILEPPNQEELRVVVQATTPEMTSTPRAARRHDELEKSWHATPRKVKNLFLDQFPVALSGTSAPSISEICIAMKVDVKGAEVLRKCWYYQRVVDRADHLASCFRRVPTEDQIMAKAAELEYGKQMKQMVNVIMTKVQVRVDERRRNAAPSKEDKLDEWARMIELKNDDQSWTGLQIRHKLGSRDRGVFATKTIMEGDLICNYKGKLMSAKKYQKYKEDRSEEVQENICNYVVFVQWQDEKWYVLAHKEDNSYGRLMNHSKKHFNCKVIPVPIKTFVGASAEPTDSIGIGVIATSEIEPGEEILWFYGKEFKQKPWLVL
jgi:hypothetical protein